MPKEKTTKACFLDRDGVLIKEVNYLSKPEQISFYSDTFSALRLLQKNGYKIFIITNQSGIARGYFPESTVKLIHNEINKQLQEHGLTINGYYYCPHYPESNVKKYSKDCNCRKPKPGLILKAAKEHSIDLTKSFFIGDKPSDLYAAKNAGCFSILVETGYGKEHKQLAINEGFIVKSNIKKAVEFFIDKIAKTL